MEKNCFGDSPKRVGMESRCDVVIAKCMEREKELALRHQQARELASLFNNTDGSLIKLKNRLRDSEMAPEIKSSLQQFVSRVRLTRAEFSMEELQSLKAFIDRKLNVINESHEFLEVFLPESSIRRYVHRGMFFKGQMNGKGEYYDYDPATHSLVYYSGNFENDQMSGDGTYWEFLGSGCYSKRSGTWRENQLWNGEEIKRLGSGNTIRTEILNGVRGKSYVFNRDNRLVYIGRVVNGKKDGEGIEVYPENETIAYIGSFVDGQREGNGLCYDRRQRLQHQGKWTRNRFDKNSGV